MEKKMNNKNENGMVINEGMMAAFMQAFAKELAGDKEKAKAFIGGVVGASGLKAEDIFPKTEVAECTEKVNDAIREQIKGSGWVKNPKLYHNHAERKMYEMLGSIDDARNHNRYKTSNYQEAFKKLTYGYSFDFIKDSLDTMVKVKDWNPQYYMELARWFTPVRIKEIILDDIALLSKYISMMNVKFFTKNYEFNMKGYKVKDYVRDADGKMVLIEKPDYRYVQFGGSASLIRIYEQVSKNPLMDAKVAQKLCGVKSELSKNCVFLAEAGDAIITPLREWTKLFDELIEDGKEFDPKELLGLFNIYNKVRVKLPYEGNPSGKAFVNPRYDENNKKSEPRFYDHSLDDVHKNIFCPVKSNAFNNIYRGLGAYRTIKNWVRFDGVTLTENCFSPYSDTNKVYDRAESLEELEKFADKCGWQTSWQDGYCMLGVLYDIVRYIVEWKEWPSKK